MFVEQNTEFPNCVCLTTGDVSFQYILDYRLTKQETVINMPSFCLLFQHWISGRLEVD